MQLQTWMIIIAAVFAVLIVVEYIVLYYQIKKSQRREDLTQGLTERQKEEVKYLLNDIRLENKRMVKSEGLTQLQRKQVEELIRESKSTAKKTKSTAKKDTGKTARKAADKEGKPKKPPKDSENYQVMKLYEEGKSDQEIAKELGMTPGQVKLMVSLYGKS